MDYQQTPKIIALHLVKIVKLHLCLSLSFCTIPRDAHLNYLPKLSYRVSRCSEPSM